MLTNDTICSKGGDNMKDFNEFLKEVDVKDITNAFLKNEIHNSSEMTKELASQISEMSTTISLILLRQYHEWLSE